MSQSEPLLDHNDTNVKSYSWENETLLPLEAPKRSRSNNDIFSLSPDPKLHRRRRSQSSSIRDEYLLKLGYTPLLFEVEKERDALIDRGVSKLSDVNSMGGEKNTSYKNIIPPPGSIRGSVFNLAGATLGAGALSLPYAIAVSGLVFGVLQIVVASLLTIYTIRLLIHAGEVTGFKSYEDLATFCFGKKFAIFVELNILVFCFGISIAYLVTLGDIITPLGQLLFGTSSLLGQRWFLMSSLCMTIMMPLSLLKDISRLQFFSILGVLSIVFLVGSVVMRSAIMIARDGVHDGIEWGLNISNGVDFILGVPIVMFAFTCQVNVFSIYTELQRPCIRRMNKVVDRATLISFLLYFSIGIFAYLGFGPTLIDPSVKGNVLLSFRLDDELMAFSRAAIAFTVCVAFPLNIFPCRFTLEMMFFSNEPASTMRHSFVTCGLVLAALGLAIFCPSINVVFGIIGGTCSSIVCFCLPAAYIIKLEKGSLFSREKFGPLLLLLGAVAIGIVSTTVTIWSNFIRS